MMPFINAPMPLLKGNAVEKLAIARPRRSTGACSMANAMMRAPPMARR